MYTSTISSFFHLFFYEHYNFFFLFWFSVSAPVTINRNCIKRHTSISTCSSSSRFTIIGSDVAWIFSCFCCHLLLFPFASSTPHRFPIYTIFLWPFLFGETDLFIDEFENVSLKSFHLIPTSDSRKIHLRQFELWRRSIFGMRQMNGESKRKITNGEKNEKVSLSADDEHTKIAHSRKICIHKNNSNEQKKIYFNPFSISDERFRWDCR